MVESGSATVGFVAASTVEVVLFVRVSSAGVCAGF
jgi:hypothetical protein